MFSIAAILVIIAAVVGTGTMVAFFAFLLNRIREVERGREPAMLADQVQAIREQLLDVQDQITALQERVDFTDKLLTGGEEHGDIESP